MSKLTNIVTNLNPNDYITIMPSGDIERPCTVCYTDCKNGAFLCEECASYLRLAIKRAKEMEDI